MPEEYLRVDEDRMNDRDHESFLAMSKEMRVIAQRLLGFCVSLQKEHRSANIFTALMVVLINVSTQLDVPDDEMLQLFKDNLEIYRDRSKKGGILWKKEAK